MLPPQAPGVSSASVYEVSYPSGTKVLGGGVIETTPTNFFTIQSSGPLTDTTWAVVLVNDTSEQAARTGCSGLCHVCHRGVIGPGSHQGPIDNRT